MAKLVAFYSRADENYFGGQMRYIEVGNTELIAKMIADLLGAEMFKIEQKIPYAKEYDKCIAEAKKDLQAKARPEIINMPNDIDKYDEVYIGFPNYWSDMPMAVYTFLENFSWEGKTVHPFCTHEGSGFSGIIGKIEKNCKGANVKKGLAIKGSLVNDSYSEIENWIKNS